MTFAARRAVRNLGQPRGRVWLVEEQLLETWAIHARINRYLLDAIPAATLSALSASRGRPVGEQFAHIHDVRLMWLEGAAPEVLAGVEKLGKAEAGDAGRIGAALDGSAPSTALLAEALRPGGRVRGFRPHPAAFLGYLIAHESHHRGQIALTLKQAGHPLDRKIAYGLWEWGAR